MWRRGLHTSAELIAHRNLAIATGPHGVTYTELSRQLRHALGRELVRWALFREEPLLVQPPAGPPRAGEAAERLRALRSDGG